MVVAFITTYAIDAYYHERCDFESRSSEVHSIQHNVIKCVSDVRMLVVSPASPVPSSKTDRHDIAEILLKGALNSITLTLTPWKLNIMTTLATTLGVHSVWQMGIFTDWSVEYITTYITESRMLLDVRVAKTRCNKHLIFIRCSGHST